MKIIAHATGCLPHVDLNLLNRTKIVLKELSKVVSCVEDGESITRGDTALFFLPNSPLAELSAKMPRT